MRAKVLALELLHELLVNSGPVVHETPGVAPTRVDGLGTGSGECWFQ